MNKRSKPSPDDAGSREQQLDQLLTAMDASDPFSRYGLEPVLEQIEARWLAAQGKKQDRKRVRQYRAAITKALALSNMIGPDFFANEIEKAGWSRLNPNTDDRTLHTLMADYGHERDDVVAVLTAHGLDIDHWLKTSGDAYRKRDVRRLVVEPFLQDLAGWITERKNRRAMQARKAQAIEHRRRAGWRKREQAAASFQAECLHPHRRHTLHQIDWSNQ
jgi:hypothetical protein